MGKDLRQVIEELKQRRDNIDAAIKILEDEVCPEESPEPERKRPGRPRKSVAALGFLKGYCFLPFGRSGESLGSKAITKTLRFSAPQNDTLF